MKNLQLNDRINIGLLKFVDETRDLEARMVKFSEMPNSNFVDLQLFRIGIAEDAAKGLLAMNNKLTGISEDAMKILFSVAEWSSHQEEISLKTLQTVLNGLEDGEQDLEALYKFYETCKLVEICFEISYYLSGDGPNVPMMEACYMANPELFEKIINGPKWEFEYEKKIQDNVIRIFKENSNGKAIYKKLNDLLTSQLAEVKYCH